MGGIQFSLEEGAGQIMTGMGGTSGFIGGGNQPSM